MFRYLYYIFGEHCKQESIAELEDDSNERLSIDTYTIPCFLEPLKYSCREANLRKTTQSDICEKISSVCTEINSWLPHLNDIINFDQILGLKQQFDIIALATIYYNLGIIYKDCLELQDLQLSLYNLSRSRELIEGIELDCHAILLAVKTLIAMSEIQETQRWLSEAIQLYLKYVELDNFRSTPIYTYLADVSEAEDLRKLLISSCWTIIKHMEMLYSSSGEMDKWIKTVHDFLNYRVTIIKSPTEACMWSDAAVSISTYFINKLRFNEARDCLAAAEHMLKRVQRASSHSCHNIVEILKGLIANTWLTYATYILRESSSHLQAQQQTSSEPNQEEPQEFLLLFTSLSEHLEYIEKITSSRVSNLVDAETVLLFALQQCQVVITTFSALNNSNYCDAISNCASTFKYLASFSTDILVQRKVYNFYVNFCFKMYKKYRKEVGHLSLLDCTPHLIVIVDLWKDATGTFLSVINRSKAYPPFLSFMEERHQRLTTMSDKLKEISTTSRIKRATPETE